MGLEKPSKIKNRHPNRSENTRSWPTIAVSLMLATYCGILGFAKSPNEVLLAKNLETETPTELVQSDYNQICSGFNYSDICQNQ